MRTITATFLAAAISVVALGTAAHAENPMVGGAPMYADKNIVEYAVNSKDHTTLVAAVKAAGLVETLQGDGPFTVFAPTNEAFAKLPDGTVETLLKPENKDQLTKILTCHVVGADAMSKDIMKMVDDDKGDRECSKCLDVGAKSPATRLGDRRRTGGSCGDGHASSLRERIW